MPNFSEAVEVRTDADTAWHVVGDLVSVQQWIPGIIRVQMFGTTRVCTFDDGNVLREEILDYDPVGRSYRYTIDGGLPVKDNNGRLSVRPAGGGSRVVLDSSWQALDPATEEQVAKAWSEALPGIMARLKEAIEAGRP